MYVMPGIEHIPYNTKTRSRVPPAFYFVCVSVCECARCSCIVYICLFGIKSRYRLMSTRESRKWEHYLGLVSCYRFMPVLPLLLHLLSLSLWRQSIEYRIYIQISEYVGIKINIANSSESFPNKTREKISHLLFFSPFSSIDYCRLQPLLLILLSFRFVIHFFFVRFLSLFFVFVNIKIVRSANSHRIDFHTHKMSNKKCGRGRGETSKIVSGEMMKMEATAAEVTAFLRFFLAFWLFCRLSFFFVFVIK